MRVPPPEEPLALWSRTSRRWTIAHLVSLGIALLVLVLAARGQWFFYDEWDFLPSRAEWNLLGPHNGHLSFFPQLLTTLTKGVVGLEEYWPYLGFTIAVHLLLAHLLWRVMLRTGSHPLVALLVSTIFAVLAPGAENTLWAFQVGFITPLVTGAAALLIAMRPDLRRRDILIITALLIVGVGFAGTAIPITGALLVFLLVRHGWRVAVLIGGVFGAVYGVWYLAFNRGSQGTDGMRASSAYDVLVRMPEYISHGFVDSLAKTIPFDQLAPALVLLFAVWLVLDVRKGGAGRISAVHALVLAALAFSLLTAFTRVQLGVESASAGRYVYVYVALLVPAAGRCLSVLAGRGRVGLTAVSVVLAMTLAFNVGGLLQQAAGQATLEQSVNRAISAAIDLDDGSDELAGRRPSPIVAPPLTMADIREFVARGQYTPVEYSDSDELDVRLNLFLRAEPVAAPEGYECAPVDDEGFVALDDDEPLVESSVDATVRVRAVDGDAQSQFAQVQLPQGWSELSGVDGASLRLEVPSNGSLCAALPVDGQ